MRKTASDFIEATSLFAEWCRSPTSQRIAGKDADRIKEELSSDLGRLAERINEELGLVDKEGYVSVANPTAELSEEATKGLDAFLERLHRYETPAP